MTRYDLLSGLLYLHDREATENSRVFVARDLTADELDAHLTQDGIIRGDAEKGEHTRLGGHQIIWQPSTTDTGETR